MKDYYEVLGVERGCAVKEVRGAFRALIKRWHPDVCRDAVEAEERARELNEAYETLTDPARRRAHDEELGIDEPVPRSPVGRAARDVKQDVFVSAEELIRGVSLEVRVDDPANPDGPECYQLELPEGTAPGERFKIARAGAMAGGVVAVRVKVRPGGLFRAKGSDLRMDLRISGERAKGGGTEMVPGPAGGMVRVEIPAGVARNAVLRVAGEGLPKARGGRGDLLVRVRYRVEVRVTRGGRSDGGDSAEERKRLW